MAESSTTQTICEIEDQMLIEHLDSPNFALFTLFVPLHADLLQLLNGAYLLTSPQ